MRLTVHVLPTAAEAAAAAAEALATAIAAGGHVALSGGSTPRAAYAQLAATGVDFARATLWYGDDRAVPPDDPRSNHRMVREALLDPLGDRAPDVRRIEGELGAEAAAARYDAALRTEVEAFDLVLNGLGPDGHTASLFPHAPALGVTDRHAVAVPEAGMEPFVPRVTLTIPVMRAARTMVFLVAGEDKRDAVRRAFAGPPSPATPASLVHPDGGDLTLLLDEAAAPAELRARA